MAILGPILAPTWLHFGAQDRPNSSKNTISRGIKNLIDSCIDFFSNFLPFLDPRRPQARPQRVPRRPQEAAKRPPKNISPAIVFGHGRQEAPRAPRDPSKSNFWSIFDRFFDVFLNIFWVGGWVNPSPTDLPKPCLLFLFLSLSLSLSTYV